MATLYDNLQGGSITDDPLTSGATTISSSAFQYLPTVTSPDIMYLTLDPAGANGAPEIVRVTAHAAASTTVTVVRGQQDTAAREHPAGSAWLHGLTEADVGEFLKSVGTANIQDNAVTSAKIALGGVGTLNLLNSSVTTAKLADGNVTTAKLADAAVTLAKLASALADRLPQPGDLKTTVSTAETAHWKNHNQTLVGAQTAFPLTWAVAPASWKSGSNLVIPNLADVALIGAGTIATLGAVAGSNTATLAEANLPAHTHAIDHDHPSTTSSSDAHTHAVDPPATTLTNPFGGGEGFLGTGTAGSPDYTVPNSPAVYGFTKVDSLSVNISSFNSGSDSHSHTVDLPAFSGPSGSTGSGTPFSIVGRSLGVNIQVLCI